MKQALYEINLNVSSYELLVINDLFRMFIIQLVVQGLFVLRHGNLSFLSQIFIENTLFILLGILIYWLVFNYIIKFKTDTENSKNLNNHYQNNYNI
jgi:energy-coupling factor transporter transmembrane protein EcfT|tara:strand:- start:39 stop:326 length:288 start_codon:yes stop_codon:yes gene_type:complete